MSEIDFIFHENEEKVIMRYAEWVYVVCVVSRNLWPKLAYCCVDSELYYNFQPIIDIWLRFDEQGKSENQVTLSRFIFCWINDSSDWEWCNRWRWITTKDIIINHFWDFFFQPTPTSNFDHDGVWWWPFLFIISISVSILSCAPKRGYPVSLPFPILRNGLFEYIFPL